MQKKLQTFVDGHINGMKDEIRKILLEQPDTSTNDKLEQIFAISPPIINIEEFTRKKRVRNYYC